MLFPPFLKLLSKFWEVTGRSPQSLLLCRKVCRAFLLLGNLTEVRFSAERCLWGCSQCQGSASMETNPGPEGDWWERLSWALRSQCSSAGSQPGALERLLRWGICAPGGCSRQRDEQEEIPLSLFWCLIWILCLGSLSQAGTCPGGSVTLQDMPWWLCVTLDTQSCQCEPLCRLTGHTLTECRSCSHPQLTSLSLPQVHFKPAGSVCEIPSLQSWNGFGVFFRVFLFRLLSNPPQRHIFVFPDSLLTPPGAVSSKNCFWLNSQRF